jgi:REP element-mobilizing transposase RayT
MDDQDPDIFFNEQAETWKTARYLPHWRQGGKLFFVTWRQCDSLPQERLEELVREREVWQRAHGHQNPNDLSVHLRREYTRLFRERVEQWLDAGHGSCVLKQPAARSIMAKALHHFEGVRYRLGSFAIAGNHVHVLVLPLGGLSLSSILHSWKSFTSNAINKLTGRSGSLWQDESYDRLVRDADELLAFEDYIAAHARHGHFVQRIPFVAGHAGE